MSDFHNSSNDWLNGDFKELDSAKIDEDVTEWWKTSYKLAKSLEEEFPGVRSTPYLNLTLSSPYLNATLTLTSS